MNVTNQKTLIIGLARQGMALAEYLGSTGDRVIVTDLQSPEDFDDKIDSLRQYNIEFVLEEHPVSLLDDIDRIFVSGGVPLDIPLIRAAKKSNIPISNDSQLVLEELACKTTGITGSSGKTTTTLLAGKMCSMSDNFNKVWIGGNVGNPLLSDLPKIVEKDIAILELSSFQLQLMTQSPNVAVVLNITPNHLDRHSSMQEYVMSKANILTHQSCDDIAILGWDNEVSQSMRSYVRGQCWGFSVNSNVNFDNGSVIEDGTIMLRRSGFSVPVIDCDYVSLEGSHNLMNVLASVAIAAALGIEIECIQKAITDFSGMPHRMELVSEIAGVRWINDTMATTPERTIAVLQSIDEPVILLLGGKDKNLSWESLAVEVKTRVKNIIVFGQSSALIKRSLEDVWKHPIDNTIGASVLSNDDIEFVDDGSRIDRLIKRSTAGEAAILDPVNVSMSEVSDLEEAVALAASLCNPGDVVLFAPGCTSFDQFSDAMERGEYYKELVLKL